MDLSSTKYLPFLHPTEKLSEEAVGYLENRRRLVPLDKCLARPKLVPRVMSAARFFL